MTVRGVEGIIQLAPAVWKVFNCYANHLFTKTLDCTFLSRLKNLNDQLQVFHNLENKQTSENNLTMSFVFMASYQVSHFSSSQSVFINEKSFLSSHIKNPFYY